MDFEYKLKEAILDLKTMYLDDEDTRPWAVAWSGGKDSTCVMAMLIKMLNELDYLQRNREIHVVMSDTVVENPNLESYMHNQVKLLNNYINKTKLPINVSIVQREMENSYFYLILGRGYFLPQNNGAGRWCTDRLKIKPQNEKLKEVNPSYILIGTRNNESTKRRESIEKWTSKNELGYKIGDHANLVNSKTFMPIIDFTIDDVWEYLSKERLPWGSSHSVRTLYREATGECGFTSPQRTEEKAAKSESCGARFGCWTCPVILNDKSTEQMSETHKWMEPLSKWRMLQLKVFGDYKPIVEDRNKNSKSSIIRQWEEINKLVKNITKSGHKRNGKKMIDKNNEEHRKDQGTLTVEARKYLYNKLIETENEVNKIRNEMELLPLLLISQQERDMIENEWRNDVEHYPWLVTNSNNISIDILDEIINIGERIESEAIRLPVKKYDANIDNLVIKDVPHYNINIKHINNNQIYKSKGIEEKVKIISQYMIKNKILEIEYKKGVKFIKDSLI